MLLISCQSRIKPPKGEQCIILSCKLDEDGRVVGDCPKCYCVDTTFKEDDPHYSYEVPCRAYQAVSPERFDELESWGEDRLKELAECRSDNDMGKTPY